ncbi:MAG: hypothetical protein E7360_02495 [Clostridiales bacterium]|nr:hypothetical protein [Clostridiales bacterium]
MAITSTFLTPKTLWENFTADKPLKISKINEVRYDKITYGEYYFSGRDVDGESVRIFGVYATPDEKKKYSAVLYIPDVTDTINFEVIREYVKLGYAVLAVDIYGERAGVENYTSYPKSVYYANYEKRGNYMDYVEETAKKTSWYEWVCVERFAISFLKNQPNVDKIGVIGVKDGANIAWQIAATDDRIACSVMLFGAGWKAYTSVPRYGDQSQEIPMNEERRRFIAAVEAHAYAQSVTCPILFLSATNNDKFDFDRSFDTLLRIPEKIDCSFNYSPGFKEYLDGFCEKDVELFLKKYLSGSDVTFPKAPELEVKQDGTFFDITVKCDGQDKVAECKVYVNEGVEDPSLRNWMPCEQKETDGELNFEYVVSGNTSKIFAFAVVKYKSGVTVSSRFLYKNIQPSTAKKSGLVYTSRDGLDGITFYDKNATEIKSIFVNRDEFIKLVKGADGISGAYSHCGLISYRFGEPSWRIDERSILKFDLYTNEFCVLRLIFMQKTASGTQEFVYTTEIKAGSIWQNIVVKIGEFKSAEGMSIRKYDDIYALRIEGDGKYAVNNILLI